MVLITKTINYLFEGLLVERWAVGIKPRSALPNSSKTPESGPGGG